MTVNIIVSNNSRKRLPVGKTLALGFANNWPSTPRASHFRTFSGFYENAFYLRMLNLVMINLLYGHQFGVGCGLLKSKNEISIVKSVIEQ